MLTEKYIKNIHNNFGLGDCSFSNLVWTTERILQFFGLTIRNRQGSITILKYILTFAMQFFTYQVGCVLYYVYVVMPSGKSILQNIECSVVYNISVFNLGKMLWFLLGRTNIAEMINLGLELDNNISHNKQWKDTILTRMRPVKIRCIVLSAIWTITTFNHIVKPAFLPKRELPDPFVVYPGLVPITETPNYQIGYTLQIITIFIMLLTSLGYLTLFITISGHAGSHMRLLADQLDLLNKVLKITNFKKNPRIMQDFDQRLKFIISTHNKVKKFVKKSSDTFNGIISFDVFVLVCLSCVLTLQLESWHDIATYLPIFALPVTVITLYCVLGQYVIDASEQFENIVYNFDWDDLNVTRRKTFYMITMNAQDPLVFKFLCVLPLDHKMLMSIVKIVYSVYTALNSARKYMN